LLGDNTTDIPGATGYQNLHSFLRDLMVLLCP
jgi:hypothetical protein